MASQKKKTAKAAGSKKKPVVTTAIHAHSVDGAEHLVGIGNLRVMVFNDDGSWFAQGLEIDYFAEGQTLEEVQTRFRDGLSATIDYLVKLFGDIDGVLQVAPPEVWKEFFGDGATLRKRYSQVSYHTGQGGELAFLPFTGVAFLKAAA